MDNTFSDNVSDNIFARNKIHEEYQYLNLIENILENGHLAEGRKKSIFGHSMRFSLANGSIPILTTKKTDWKTCLKELLWFIRGETNTQLLKNQNVHIWDDNSSREFLDSKGLKFTKEGLIGPGYGYQWRNFNANYNCFSGKKLLDDNDQHDLFKEVIQFKGIDQLQQIIDLLKNPETRNSCRLVMTAWNPCQLDQMALLPCHILCQFNVHDGNKLSCSMYQMSNDVCEINSNIASYSFLTHLLAKHCGLEAYEFIHFIGNCYICENAIDACKTQILREPFPFPTVSINNIRENINDYQVEDFEIHFIHF